MSWSRALPLVTVLCVQLVACLVARHTGPLAISDDDYARVVIAQELVRHPQLDPTGTSWLPLPFYVTGGIMAVLGTALDVARGAQVFLALASSALLYFGARRLGLERWWAALAVGLGACLPTAARLAAATVPEYPTSACLAFSLLCLAAEAKDRATAGGTGVGAAGAAAALPQSFRAQLIRHRWPLLGALSCFCSCAARYEAWPVAGAYAGVMFCFALRERIPSARTWTYAIAAVALAFPALWLLHGIVVHGDAFFFVTRVTRYKAALGGPAPDPWAALFGYPLAALSQEPGAIALLASSILLAKRTHAGRLAVRSLWPALLALGVLLIVLVLGDVRGGAPTHHPERALLSLWLMVPAVSLLLLLGATRSWTRLLPLIGVAAVVTVLVRPTPGAFADRAEEEHLGRLLEQTSGEIVVLTPDYGHFALQAASGSPDRFHVIDRHDPREERPSGSPEELVQAAIASSKASFVVVPTGVPVAGFRIIEGLPRLTLLKREQASTMYARARGRAADVKL